MTKVEVHRPDQPTLVGELTTERALSSFGQPVFVAETGQVMGPGDLTGGEIRVRDPRDLDKVREWLSDWPQFDIRVAHGGPRGGPQKWSGATLRRLITFERDLWLRLQAKAKSEGRSAPEIIQAALLAYLNEGNQ